MESHLQKSIDVLGSQTALAKAVSNICGHKVWQSHISAWKTAKKGVPAEYCLAIEQATGGKVTAAMLRPDVFPSGGNHEARY